MLVLWKNIQLFEQYHLSCIKRQKNKTKQKQAETEITVTCTVKVE